MQRVFAALMVMEALLLGLTSYQGLVMDTGESALTHVTSGFLTAIYHMFVHCLVMFYLIGSGKDIKRAVEDQPALREEFVPLTRRLKRRVFPPATFAILAILIAAFAGAYVHSELLASGDTARTPADPLPVRAIGLWWIHLALLIPAVLINIFGFVVEAAAIRDNVGLIRRVNDRLESARKATGPHPPGGNSPKR